jgi:hypothetical protein
LKIESQDQQISYEPVMEFIKGCGFFFSFPVPSEAVLCAMKIAAMLDRGFCLGSGLKKFRKWRRGAMLL